ncbi:MAG: class I SAM-dependent methyltransferase [Zoogloeaceae bacterium]|nr:class I SAM-dependent methyltransferase [Rhodocyclaceae bacterium]MCP5237943.1 class I SAM-dependent methyltransferase [Zoogloeaceae bacterium]
MSAASPSRRLQRWLRPLEGLPIHPQWLLLRHRPATRAWVGAHAHGTLLDIGCGNGELRDALPTGVRYVGIDYPPTVALGYAGGADALADGRRLPVAGDSVDTVALIDVLEHLDRADLAVAEAARVLREDGRCLIHVPFLYPLHDLPHDYQRWTAAGIERLLERNGLAPCEISATMHPLEVSAGLMAIALADSVIHAARAASPSLLLAPLLLLAVLPLNLAGWLLGKLLPRSGLMPFSYRVVARKVRSAVRRGGQ